MHRVPTHIQWLRRFGLASVLLTVIVIAWSSAIGVLMYGLLGVRLGTVSGQPATFAHELEIHGLDAAPLATFVHGAFLFVIFAARHAYRWRIVAALLLLLGTPVALVSGWRIADYLWTLNRGGVPWEGIAPQPLGIAIAWIVGLLASAWLDRYRIIVVKQVGGTRSPCPRCGYELHGSNSGVCPECGWTIPWTSEGHGMSWCDREDANC
jgi:hypothetical protein